MSLNWNIGKIKDYKTVTASPFNPDELHPVTNALIWATMSVDIGEITEANVKEFAWRLRFTQLLFGHELGTGTSPVYLTEEDVRLHIGLSTNVIDKPRHLWIGRFTNIELSLHPARKQVGSAYEIAAAMAKTNAQGT